MKILSRYIRDDFALTLAITLLVLTFVMCVMVLFRMSDFIAMGGSGTLILWIFLTGIPSALRFSIPASALTSALLTFGKLSANGEITAMKSSGISMWQIIRQPMLIALFLTALCLYLNAEFIPRSDEERRDALRDLGTQSPLSLLEEGRFIRDFPGYTVYFGSKKDDRLQDIIIYQHVPQHVQRVIRANNGTIATAPDKSKLLVDLYDVRVDPFYEDKPGSGHCDHFPIEIALGRATDQKPGAKNKNDMTATELISLIADPAQAFPELDADGLAHQTLILTIELDKRIVLSLSCFAFVLLGIPLATRTHRRESTIGIGISLVLVFFFHLFVIVAESLAKHQNYQPQLIIWTAPVLAVVLGLYLLRRVE